MPEIINLKHRFAGPTEASGHWLPVGVEYHQEVCKRTLKEWKMLADNREYSVVAPHIGALDEPNVRAFINSLVADRTDNFSGDLVISRRQEVVRLCCRHMRGSVLNSLLPLRWLGPHDTVLLSPDPQDYSSPPSLETEYWRELILRSGEFFVLGRRSDSFGMVRLFAEKGDHTFNPA